MRLTRKLLISSIVLVSLLTSGGMTIAVGQGTIDLPTSLADQTAKVEYVKTGLAYCEGPAVDKNGNLFFFRGFITAKQNMESDSTRECNDFSNCRIL
jgi:hypothetical protein